MYLLEEPILPNFISIRFETTEPRLFGRGRSNSKKKNNTKIPRTFSVSDPKISTALSASLLVLSEQEYFEIARAKTSTD